MSRLKPILGPNCDELHDIVARAKRGQQLTETLRRALPSPEGTHVVYVDVNNGRAVLSMDSPAWATRVRYLAPQILAFLRQHLALAEGAQLHIRVAPQELLFDHDPPPRQLSESAATTLRDCADAIDDATLKAALRRLANRAQET